MTHSGPTIYAYVGTIILRRRTTYLIYLLHLAVLCVPLEQHIARQQLRKDASHRPQINLVGVVALPHQQFGCAVPQRHHLVGVLGVGQDAHRASQPKVRDAHLTLVVQQQIRGLEVAVNDAILVQVLHTLQDLLEDALQLRQVERVLHAMKTRKIVIHVIKHQEGGPYFLWFM